MKKTSLISLTILISLLLVAPIVMAQGFQLPADLKPQYAPNYTVGGQNNIATANAIMQILAGGLIYVAAPFAVLLIAIGGLRYTISRGDQTAMDEAKKNITWAIIGLIVIALSWAIVVNIIRIITAIGTPPT